MKSELDKSIGYGKRHEIKNESANGKWIDRAKVHNRVVELFNEALAQKETEASQWLRI